MAGITIVNALGARANARADDLPKYARQKPRVSGSSQEENVAGTAS